MSLLLAVEARTYAEECLFFGVAGERGFGGVAGATVLTAAGAVVVVFLTEARATGVDGEAVRFEVFEKGV